MNRKQNAFTLIELMLVLVILASLAAIVAPKFTNQAKRARLVQAKTQISQLETALDAFNIDIGRYPTTMEGLQALVEKPVSVTSGWREPYFKKQSIPKDPWANDYQYKCPGQHNQYDYDLWSYGPDGKAGGDDDIDNWSDDSQSGTGSSNAG